MTFKQKEVISMVDGKRLGYVQDVEADFNTGKITAIIVPGNNKFFGIGSKNDYVIPWEQIAKIGDDIILVNI